MLDALEADEFGSAREQEGVVVQDAGICGGTPFKFTGDFIVGGLASTFEEAKYKKGALLKEFQEREEPEVDKKEYIILIPGGFKPPTAGHYHMIKHYDDQSDVRKVLVITGPKPREGVGLEQSKKIFNIYGGFSEKVQFVETDDPTPLRTCYEFMQDDNFVNQFPNARFSIGASDKGGDPKRIQGFVSYFEKNKDRSNAEIDYYPPVKAYEVDGGAASASRMRKAYFDQDWETFKKLLPHEDLYNDVVQVLQGRDHAQTSMVAENFLLAAPQSFLVNESWKNVPTDGTSLNEADQVMIDKVRNHLNQALGELIIGMPELTIATKDAQKKAEQESMVDTLADTIADYLSQTIEQKADKKQAAQADEVESLTTEISVGANVAGAPQTIGVEEDERKTAIA